MLSMGSSACLPSQLTVRLRRIRCEPSTRAGLTSRACEGVLGLRTWEAMIVRRAPVENMREDWGKMEGGRELEGAKSLAPKIVRWARMGCVPSCCPDVGPARTTRFIPY